MTFSCRSYIDALSANVQRVYSRNAKFFPKSPLVPHDTLEPRNFGPRDPSVGRNSTSKIFGFVGNREREAGSRRIELCRASTWYRNRVVSTYFPAANTQKEAHHIGLLLLLELFDILEGTHFDCGDGVRLASLNLIDVVMIEKRRERQSLSKKRNGGGGGQTSCSRKIRLPRFWWWC